MKIQIESANGAQEATFAAKKLVIAGWTGRDRRSVDAHVEELRELGVAPPKTVPIFYRVSASLLTQEADVAVVGRESSGEVEAVLLKHEGALFVGVGSDHTDRKLEAAGITISKQLCAKPVSIRVWPWAEVGPHWDQIVLRSTVPGEAAPYQQAAAAQLLRPDDLLSLYESREGLQPDGTVLFCGTPPVNGKIRYSDRLSVELDDPVLKRSLRHDYSITSLPIAEA